MRPQASHFFCKLNNSCCKPRWSSGVRVCAPGAYDCWMSCFTEDHKLFQLSKWGQYKSDTLTCAAWYMSAGVRIGRKDMARNQDLDAEAAPQELFGCQSNRTVYMSRWAHWVQEMSLGYVFVVVR